MCGIVGFQILREIFDFPNTEIKQEKYLNIHKHRIYTAISRKKCSRNNRLITISIESCKTQKIMF